MENKPQKNNNKKMSNQTTTEDPGSGLLIQSLQGMFYWLLYILFAEHVPLNMSMVRLKEDLFSHSLKFCLRRWYVFKDYKQYNGIQ